MNAYGIVLITGFLSTLFEVIFLITSRTTHLEGLLPTVRTFTLYLLSTWLTPKTTGKNDGGYSSIEIPIPQLTFLLYTFRIVYIFKKHFPPHFVKWYHNGVCCPICKFKFIYFLKIFYIIKYYFG